MSIQPEQSAPPPGPGPRSVWSIIGETFRLFGRHLGVMLPMVALVVVPLLAAGVASFGPDYMEELMGGPGNGMVEPLQGTTIIAIGAYLVLYAVGMMAVTAAVSEVGARSLAGHDLSIGRAYGVAIRRLPHMIGAGLVAGLVVAAPVALAVVFTIPSLFTRGVQLLLTLILLALAVYLAVRLLFAPLIALFQQAGPLSAVSRSWELVSGAWFRTFGLLVVVGLILGLLQAVVAHITGTVAAVEAFLTSLLVLPLSIIGNLLIYLDLRARKQSYATVQLSEELDALAS